MGKSKKKSLPKQTYRPLHLRKWRKFAKLSQEQLAEKAETTGATISRLERGEQPYSQALLEKLADVLGCRDIDLLSRDPGPADKILAILNGMSPDSQSRALAVLQALNDNDTTRS